jgi:hypothetical protein
VARILNNTEFFCLNAFGYPFSSGPYTYGFGYNSLSQSCKNGSVCGIFIGANSGRRTNTAIRVIAIGNDAIGRAPLSGKTGISDLVVIGSCVMSEFDCGSGFNTSVGIGFEVFKSSVDTPSFNVAIGHRSMCNIVQPSKNVMIGYYTGKYMNGTDNVAIGTFSGETFTSASRNLFIGFRAGQYMGGDSFGNVIIGYRAGDLVGLNNGIISIGHCSTTNPYSYFHTSFGNSYTTFNKVGASAWSIASDRYDKTDISDLPDNLGLNFIRKLKPVKFKLDPRDRYVNKCGFEFGQRDHTLANEKESYGFLAQEIEESIAELGARFDAVSCNEFTDSYRLRTTDLIAPTIKSLKQTLDRLEIIENKLKDN